MAEHWRQKLNNLLQQSNLGVNALQWVPQQFGTQHAGYWEATALINQVEYGRGRGNSLSEAKEQAAHLAYQALLHRIQNGRV